MTTTTITIKAATEIARRVKPLAERSVYSMEMALDDELRQVGLQMPASMPWDGHDIRSVDRIAKSIRSKAVPFKAPTDAEIAKASAGYWDSI